jgi:hypothetical protein
MDWTEKSKFEIAIFVVITTDVFILLGKSEFNFWRILSLSSYIYDIKNRCDPINYCHCIL